MSFIDPVVVQNRQAARMARLQQMGGIVNGPVLPGHGEVIAPAQPTDYARTITGGLGFAGGASLASAGLKLIPHPAAQAAGWGMTGLKFAAPMMAGAFGSGAATNLVDAVAPGLHESVNSGISKTGYGIPIAGAALAGAYMMRRGRGLKPVVPGALPPTANTVMYGPHAPGFHLES